MSDYNSMQIMGRGHQQDLLEEVHIDGLARAARGSRPGPLIVFRQLIDRFECRASGWWYRLQVRMGRSLEATPCS